MTSLRPVTSRNSKIHLAVSVLSTAMVIVTAFPRTAKAEDVLGLSGSARFAGWERDKSFSSDRGYAVGGIWLQARPKEIAGFKAFFDARLQGQNLSRTQDSDGDLREAYVEKSWGDFDFKVGRQITVWGRADKLNPTDVWSSRDFGLLVVDDEDQRMGALATQIAWNLGSYRLLALWQPEWRAPKYPISGLPAGTTIRNGQPDAPAGQFGLKLDHAGGDIDWSVSYSNAIDRLPDLRVVSASASATNLEFAYNRIDVFGADFAKNIGEFGFRGEIAYVRTRDSDGRDPLVKNSYAYAVIGADRSFFGDFNINVQYVYRRASDHRSSGEVTDPAVRALAQQTQIFSNQKDAEFHAASVRASYKAFHDTLETELALVGWFNNGLIRPKATYAFTDTIKGSIGAELYRGTEDSFFGRLREASSGFAEVRYLF